ILAAMPEIVEDHKGPIGPATQNRMVKAQRTYGRVDVIGPRSRITVALARLVRETMAPQIHCDEPAAIAHVRVELATPGEAALRKAVDEENRPAARGTRFGQVEPCSSAACNLVGFHPSPPFAVSPDRQEKGYAGVSDTASASPSRAGAARLSSIARAPTAPAPSARRTA